MVVGEKKYTLDEFHTFVERPEQQNRLFELINGEIVEKVGSFKPSEIAAWIITFLNVYLLKTRLGYVTGADGSYILAPNYEFIPDAAYISKTSLPDRPERQVFGAPNLAVEVKSPTDSKRELRQKAEDYLRFGTKMVWLVCPDDQRVEVYIPDQDVIEVNLDGIIDGGAVLPGFALPVRDIFPQ
jgi:Uma2 family endonuclease